MWFKKIETDKFRDWLTDWLTDRRIKNMYTPRNFLHGLRKADEWYTMVVLNKVIALGWSQETTDRQTFYKETGFWSHRSNLSALSPKFWLNASKWKTSDNFYEALRQTSCRFGHYFAKERMPRLHKTVTENIYKGSIWVCRFTPLSMCRRFAIKSLKDTTYYILPISLPDLLYHTFLVTIGYFFYTNIPHNVSRTKGSFVIQIPYS